MKKLLLLLCLTTFLFTSCHTHKHIFGKGAPYNARLTQLDQWYLVWGLVTIGGNVDTKAIVGDAQDYEITTEESFIDCVVNFFIGWTTVSKRTVSIKK